MTSPARADDSNVSFVGHGGLTLQGTVVAPPSDGKRHPAVVLVHGAGTHTRDDYRPEAEAFARAGIVALIYDKRTVGYSLSNRSYSTLANDALAGVRLLRGRPDVDPSRVGLWGLSEGGWVVPHAAARSSEVAFVLTIGANGVQPLRQEIWSKGNRLRHQGVSGSMLRTLPDTMLRVVNDAGQFPEAFYDPVPNLERLRQPVLAMWGELDQLTPPGESLEIFRAALDRAGNKHYILKTIPGGDHHGWTTPDNGFTQGSDFAPGYVGLMTSFINGLPNQPASASSDAPAAQETRTAPVEPIRWWESSVVQLVAIVLIPLMFLGYLLSRFFVRNQSSSVRGPARWLTGLGLTTLAGFFGYFGYLMMTGAKNVGPVIIGRALPWLALQLLALGAVASLIWLVVAWWRHRDDVRGGLRVRLALPLIGGLVLLPWALYWGLLLP